MLMRVKMFMIGALALVSVVAAAADAMAAPRQFCQAYARTAVIQYQKMLNTNAQCTGFRWHNWYDGHYGWCRKVPVSSAKSEIMIRRNALWGGAC